MAYDYNIQGLQTNDLGIAMNFACICREMDEARTAWIVKLRAEGFAALHPNDGWVNRKDNTFQLCYPDFEDNVDLGSKVMLGWANDLKSHRPVIVTALSKSYLSDMTIYAFRDMKEGE